MNLKIVDHSVAVVRDGKSKIIAPGTAFAFKEAELADIIRHHGEECVRDPINETAVAEEKSAKAPAAKTAKGLSAKSDEEDGI
jgi:hypothetical protein